jgi:hypothetical protein
MSAGQSKHVPVRSNEFEFSRSPLDGPPNKSAASMLIEIGVLLAEAAFAKPTPGLCSQCRNNRDARSSTAEYRNVFCSQRCEQEFIRTTLASVTLEECLRRRTANLPYEGRRGLNQRSGYGRSLRFDMRVRYFCLPVPTT